MDSGLVATDRRLNRGQIEALFRKYAPELERFLLGILRNGGSADDALQSTFVQLIDKGGDVDPEKLKAWLFRVAYNEAMGLLRREGTHRRAVQKADWWASTSDAEGDAGPRSMIRDETIESVRQAIAELPATHREIVCLRIYDGLKFVQIAERLNIPLGTVLTRMRNSMQRLERKLYDQNDETI